MVTLSDDVSRDLLVKHMERWGTGNVHCCAYNYYNGYCYWSNWSDHHHYDDWEGMEGLRFKRNGGVRTVELLLDLDEGTLTVYKKTVYAWE